MFHPFVRVVRTPGVALPVVASFLGALPIGMLGIGVLLLVHSTTGSFAVAGLVAGAFSIGNAVGLVMQGHFIDRYGPTRVLVVSGLLCPAALLGFIACTARHAPLLLIATLAVSAGAGLPATTSSLRVLLPQLIADPALRDTAYAVLATQFQIAMVVGPLLVSALVLAGGPALAVLAAAGFACGGGLLFAAAPASRHSRLAPDVPAVVRRGWLSAGLVTLLGAGLGGGAASGLMTVSVPAIAAGHGMAALVGLLFAALSAGELLGGLVYGGRAWRLQVPRRLVVGQTAAALGVVVLAVSTQTPAGMLAAMFAVGACVAPTFIASSTLLDDIAAPASLARAYTAMIAVGLIGVAAGSALGGTLTIALGARLVLLISGGVLGAVALWTTVRMRSLIVARDLPATSYGSVRNALAEGHRSPATDAAEG